MEHVGICPVLGFTSSPLSSRTESHAYHPVQPPMNGVLHSIIFPEVEVQLAKTNVTSYALLPRDGVLLPAILPNVVGGFGRAVSSPSGPM